MVVLKEGLQQALDFDTELLGTGLDLTLADVAPHAQLDGCFDRFIHTVGNCTFCSYHCRYKGLIPRELTATSMRLHG